MEEQIRVLFAGASPDHAVAAMRGDVRFSVIPPCQFELLSEQVNQTTPDIVIFDGASSSQAVIESVARIAFTAPHATLIVIDGDPALASALLPVGANGLMPAPYDASALTSYVHRTHSQTFARKRYWTEQHLVLVNPRRPKLIAVFSPKGGVGKTTVAINLAAAIATTTGQPGLLLDMDVEAGDVSVVLDLQPRRSLLDFAAAEAQNPPALAPYLTKHHSGLQVLAAPPGPEHAELIKPRHIHAAITMAKAVADFVVADTSPSFSEHQLAVLDRADLIVLLLTPDITALKNARTALEIMTDMNYPSDKMLVVMNRCSPALGLAPVEVGRALGHAVVVQIPDDSQTILTAANHGQPFVLRFPTAPASHVMLKLATRITGDQEQGARKTSKPFWRRILEGG